MSTQSANTTTSATSNNPQFTWIPFYKAFARKLLDYKNDRPKLLEKIYSLMQGIPHSNDGSQLQDIDPFSLFAIFNRGGDKFRISILTEFKNLFEISEELPKDFTGIPRVNNQNVLFFDKKNIETDINPLWEFYEVALNESYSVDLFKQLFDQVQKQKQVKWNITMGLFWIDPYRYLPLDESTRYYLESKNIKKSNDNDITGQYYLDLIERVKKYPLFKNKNFPTISLDAYCFKNGEKTMTNTSSQSENNSERIKEIVKLLKTEKNIILQGAPGTGKTYTTAETALRILGITDDDLDFSDHSIVMEQYEKMRKDHRIFFTTFHQSMDYEDFVEGLKPKIQKDKSGNPIGVTYKIQKGIFRKACAIARIPRIDGNATIWKVSLGGAGNNETKKDCFDNGYIRIGWANYGDADFSTFTDYKDEGFGSGVNILPYFQNNMKIGDIVLSLYSEHEIDAIGIVTGNYEYRETGNKYPRYRTVRWLVKGIRENIVNINNEKKLAPSTVYQLDVSLSDIVSIVKKYYSSQNSVVLIIDEINRGNVSKIFGELITLLEADKRSGKEADKRSGKEHPITVKLPYSREDFSVPSNLYIIGTMNTTDRTTGTIDYAIRRRFAFVTLEADREVIQSDTAKKLFDDVKAFIKSYRIDDTAVEDLMVGQSYFMAEKDQLKAKMEYKVIPLLKEYINDGILRRDKEQEKYFENWLKLETYTKQKTANNSDSSEEGTTNSEGGEN